MKEITIVAKYDEEETTYDEIMQALQELALIIVDIREREA